MGAVEGPPRRRLRCWRWLVYLGRASIRGFPCGASLALHPSNLSNSTPFADAGYPLPMPTRRHLLALLILAVATFGLMARAANLGGEIRHPEIRAVDSRASEADAAPGERLTLAKRWSRYVEEHAWVWPTCETLHFVGLCLLFGAALVVDLRILGVAKQLPLSAVYQLLPLGLLGFTLNLATGMAFFVATPQQYIGVLFLLKMTLVVLAAANILYFMLADEPWTVADGDGMPIRARLAAASAILIWIGVVFCGRMLPALGNSF